MPTDRAEDRPRPERTNPSLPPSPPEKKYGRACGEGQQNGDEGAKHKGKREGDIDWGGRFASALVRTSKNAKIGAKPRLVEERTTEGTRREKRGRGRVVRSPRAHFKHAELGIALFKHDRQGRDKNKSTDQKTKGGKGSNPRPSTEPGPQGT